MALKTGLFIPNTMGSQTGLNLTRSDYPTASGPTLLHTIDWTPATFSKTLGDSGSIDPDNTSTYYWNCEETSGTVLDESKEGSGTYDLTQVTGRSRTGQTAVGIPNGSNLSSYKCIETDGNAAGTIGPFRNSGNGIMKLSDGSAAIRMYFRVQNEDGLQVSVGGNKSGGVGFNMLANTSNFQVTLDDGPVLLGATDSTYGTTSGAWHFVEVIFDFTADEMRLRVDNNTQVTTDISTITQANLTTDLFAIAGTDTTTCRRLQILCAAVWTGSAAENLDSGTMPWVPGADPNAGTIFEDDTISYTGAYAVATDLGSDTGLWYMVSGDAGQVPIGYSSVLETRGAPNGFMRQGAINFAGSSSGNDCPESERIENWTATNITVSNAAADMSDNIYGFRQARKLTASADNGYVQSANSSVVAGSRTRAYVWVKGDGAAVSGRLIIWDVTAGAELGTPKAFTAPNGSWTCVEAESGFGNGTGNTVAIRIEIDTNTESIFVCGACMPEVGTSSDFIPASWGGLPVPTFGAAASPDNINGDATVATDTLDVSSGTIITHSIGTGSAACVVHPWWSKKMSTGADQIRLFKTATNNRPGLNFTDSSAANVLNQSYTNNADIENGIKYVLEWDSASPVAGSNHIQLTTNDGTEYVVSSVTSAWTAGGLTDAIIYGDTLSNTGYGVIGYTEIWDKPGGGG